jgi:glyoxylase-like metal-dependent hydrolase (beta-lactamase superfamily II)
MINIIQVRVSIDSSNSWIIQDNNEGFIIDCGCYWEHGITLARTWQEKFPNGKLPSFIFLTHTHPDNILGLVSFIHELNITQLPVYVSSSGALIEMNYWLELWKEINPFENSMLLDQRQSPDQFLYNEYIKVLDQPLKIFNNENLQIISNFPMAESIYASMVYIPSAEALFTGDLVSIHSHLLVSPIDTYPDSDSHVCDWIGILQSLSCTFPKSTLIYSTHGDGPTAMSFSDIIESNIQWLIYMRALVFNSCNTTFVMHFLEDIFQNYSNIEQSRASLANRIPYSAVSVGCNCSQNSPNTCGGLQPPSCQFLVKNRTLSLKSSAISIACIRQELFSSANRRFISMNDILRGCIMCFFLLFFFF